MVAAGLAIFGAASAACALAPTPGLLVAARAAQGVGAALLLPGGIAAIADAYPDRAAQARALGVWAAVSSLALQAGPLLGGLLVSTAGWRAVFWINPPVVAVCLVGVLAWVRASGPRPGARRLDLVGVVLATLCLAATVYAVIAASGSVAAALAAAGVAAVSAVGLIWTERRVADPLLPPELFTRPAFRTVTVAALLMNLTSNGLLFLLTRYLQSILGQRPVTPASCCCRCSRLWRRVAGGRAADRPVRPRPVMLRRRRRGRRPAVPAAGHAGHRLSAPGAGPARRRVRGGPVHRARGRRRDAGRPGRALRPGQRDQQHRSASRHRPRGSPSSARSRAARRAPMSSSPPCAGSGGRRDRLAHRGRTRDYSDCAEAPRWEVIDHH